MTNEEQLAIREALAEAQGWKSTADVHSDGTPYAHPPGCNAYQDLIPDPFTKADDLLTLLEWARKQDWFDTLFVHAERITLVPVDINANSKIILRYGSFQEALPLVVYQALQGAQNGVG